MRIGRHNFSTPVLVIAATPTILGGVALFLIGTYFPDWVAAHAAVWGPIAVLLSAFSAVLTAIIATTLNAEAQMDVAKVKAAYDAIAKKQWDADYIKARSLYLNVLRRPADRPGLKLVDYASIVDHEYDAVTEVADAIRNVVNDHELTAIAIKNNVLDEGFIKNWHRSAVVADFTRMKPYILEIRRLADNPLIFIEFERLANKWEIEIANERIAKK